MCLHCGEAIPARRLSALPWAAFCLICQEAGDGELSMERESQPPPLPDGSDVSLVDGCIPAVSGEQG
jgi:Prokaryotic dksA/traR C4-type zinc finger